MFVVGLSWHPVVWWASLYSNSKAVLSVVMFTHFLGLLVGGGAAVSYDLATLRLLRLREARLAAHVAEVTHVHRWVLAGLTLMILSGILIAAADLDTFLHSWVFWTKMALLVALGINGLFVSRADRWLSEDRPDHRARLKLVAGASLFLWAALVLAGTMLGSLA